MLANGTILMYKKDAESDFEELKGLKTVPDITPSVELIENTPLNATNKQYEPGIGDMKDLEYTFVYDGNVPGCTYRKMRDVAERNEVINFKEIWTDGTEFNYLAIPSVGFVRSGGVNTTVDLKVIMAVKSDVDSVDPDAEP